MPANLIFLGQTDRKRDLERADDVLLAAERIAARRIAGTDARTLESAEGLSTELIAVADKNRLAEILQIADFARQACYDALAFGQRHIVAPAQARSKIREIAGRPRQIVAQADVIASRGIEPVVAPVIEKLVPEE